MPLLLAVTSLPQVWHTATLVQQTTLLGAEDKSAPGYFAHEKLPLASGGEFSKGAEANITTKLSLPQETGSVHYLEPNLSVDTVALCLTDSYAAYVYDLQKNEIIRRLLGHTGQIKARLT
jgi:hypothetical protein